MFGGRIAQTLRRLNDDEYPILIFSFGRGNANHETLELIKGKNLSSNMSKKSSL